MCLRLFFIVQPCTFEAKRLDRNFILEHYRRADARGTYLATTCTQTLSNGEETKLLYILPKYQMRLAEEKPHDMSSAMKLALSQLSKNQQEVEAACANPRTLCYDLWRHIYLRQTFVACFVTVNNRVFDTHKDWMLCGGYSEHSLFIAALLQRDGFQAVPKGPLHSQAVPKGPLHSQPQKKKKKPKAWQISMVQVRSGCCFTHSLFNLQTFPILPLLHGVTQAAAKRSAATKRMLAAPEMGQSDEVVEVPAAPIKAEHYLPGMAAGSTDPSSLHCVGFPDDDAQCYASLSKGGRCTRKRTHGNFCKQHSHQFRQSDRVAAAWECFEEPLALVAQRFEAQRMDMALALSLQDNEEAKEKRRKSLAKIVPRLSALGMGRVETPGGGSCQFLSILFSAGPPVDVRDFRAQIVSYLRQQQTLFEDKIASCFGGYTQYLDSMSRPDTYGDELTIHAASHLLLRPIVVHSDSDLEPEKRFDPPTVISSDLWGAPVHIGHLGQVHFEATAEKQFEVPVKQEPRG